MDPEVSRERVREVSVTAWRAIVLVVAVVLVLAIYRNQGRVPRGLTPRVNVDTSI
jgi:anti-sigma-K factor RskA